MTTFITQNFTCQHCNHNMYTYELGSYHVYDSEAYSDGYVDYDPPISFNSHILICSNCMLPLWRSELVDDEVDYNSTDSEREQSMDVYDLPLSKKLNFSNNIANYYLGIIKDGFADSIDKEILLRIEIWHLLNNNYRFGSPSVFSYILQGKFKIALRLFKEGNRNSEEDNLNKKLFTTNLKRLIEIYKPENDEEELFLAEMNRECGNFKRAKSILKKISNFEQNKSYRIIKKAIKLRKSRVIKLN